MKIFFLILAIILALPNIVYAQQMGWGNNAAKDDLDQIDEPEANDAPETTPPPAEVQPKRTPLENPKAATKLETATPETDSDDDEVEVEAPAKWMAAKVVKLQGLNKVTAKTSPINTKIGDKVKFGNLEIQVDKCMRGPDSEKPDNTALITIWDGIPGQDKKQVFHGWMFSSSPALSGLEHPIYDVILISCTDK